MKKCLHLPVEGAYSGPALTDVPKHRLGNILGKNTVCHFQRTGSDVLSMLETPSR